MGGHLMERPKEFEDVFRGADLTKDEIRTLTWITGWERRTVENLKSAIQKVKETALSTLQAENSQLRESRDHWKRLAHELSEGVNGKDAEHERLQAENEKLRAELEQARAEITRLKYYEDKCHDCPIVCAKTEIIKAHEELERVKAELEVQKTQCDRCLFYPGKED